MSIFLHRAFLRYQTLISLTLMWIVNRFFWKIIKKNIRNWKVIRKFAFVVKSALVYIKYNFNGLSRKTGIYIYYHIGMEQSRTGHLLATRIEVCVVVYQRIYLEKLNFANNLIGNWFLVYIVCVYGEPFYDRKIVHICALCIN